MGLQTALRGSNKMIEGGKGHIAQPGLRKLRDCSSEGREMGSVKRSSHNIKHG